MVIRCEIEASTRIPNPCAIELSGTKIYNYPLRVLHGKSDTDNEYPFVVSLQTASRRRYCTGSLIAERWVLSAAHCFNDQPKLVRFGNMTVPAKEATYRPILRMFPHPNYSELENYLMINDIGLVLISAIKDVKMVKLSAVDYTTLIGSPVKYAGFGMTYIFSVLEDNSQAERLDQTKPLQIGEGVVIRCETVESLKIPTPAVCVAPQCSNKYADSNYGDSGGPLFYKNKIVAVVCSDTSVRAIGQYTPVSPYIQWINIVIGRN
ncbi:unnamed protein product [Diatraea saccharalis]|uniref:Peptidase S1 domain-containing protein n=1 Tax=Diatraea saccharalis TaxID=40085 RepID=A0A9N9WET7_9NEOP|nr:unnamed protein product [Diatraea saccharalis]